MLLLLLFVFDSLGVATLAELFTLGTAWLPTLTVSVRTRLFPAAIGPGLVQVTA